MTEPTTNRARMVGAVLAWLVAAAVATVAGMVAVGAIGAGILDRGEQPLTPSEVSDRLAQAVGTTPSAAGATTPGPTTPGPTTAGTATGGTGGTASASPPAGPATGGPTEVFSTTGGTVIARCAPGVEVVSATPAQGYRIKDIEPEDGGQRVRFESGGTRVEVQLNCVGGRPRADIRID